MKRRKALYGSKAASTSTRRDPATATLLLPYLRSVVFLFPWLVAAAAATAAVAAAETRQITAVETESVGHNEAAAAATVALDEVCTDFISPSATTTNSSLLSWQLSDCHEVWTQWAETVPSWLHGRYPDREMLRDTASEFRRLGNPCLVESELSADGVGSITMRHLAGWMLAEELGCDWVTPDWGAGRLDGNRSSVYCHRRVFPFISMRAACSKEPLNCFCCAHAFSLEL